MIKILKEIHHPKFSLKAVSDIMGVSVSVIRNLIRKGKVKADLTKDGYVISEAGMLDMLRRTVRKPTINKHK